MALSDKEALHRAMVLCSKSEKAVYDIEYSLNRWGVGSARSREKIINELKAENFINEKRFARSYVLDKHRFNKWGKLKIQSMLRGKKIDQETINEALTSLDNEKYESTLLEELIKKRKSIKASNRFDLRARLMRYASTKGYETELIYKLLDKIPFE